MRAYINMIGMQLRLMMNKKEFQLVYLINIVYIFLVYIEHVYTFWGRELSTIVSPGSASAIVYYYSRFFNTYMTLVPFLAVLPFAMSFIDDNKNQILPILQIRSGIRVYYITKGVVCFIGGFVAFFVPLLINLLLNHFTFPNSGLTFIGDLYDINFDPRVTGATLIIDTKWPVMWFPRLFLASQEMYSLLFCVIFSVSMGIFGTFIYVVSFVFKKSKLLLLLPFYLIVSCFDRVELLFRSREPYVCYMILSYLTVDGWHGKSPVFLGAFFLTVIVFIILGIYFQIQRDQLE